MGEKRGWRVTGAGGCEGRGRASVGQAEECHLSPQSLPPVFPPHPLPFFLPLLTLHTSLLPGELHLEIIVDRLRREFKVECEVGAPQVNYREGISRQAEVRGQEGWGDDWLGGQE